jgi:hypothetical protein
VRWWSVADKRYTLDRSSNLMAGFDWSVSNLLAVPPLNTYTDTTATGVCPYFYRVLLP